MTVSRVWTNVSTNWLRQQLGTSTGKQASKKIRILDTSFVLDRHADSYNDLYKKEHIPQSVHFNIFKCTPEKPGITLGWPDLNCFTDYVQSLGIWPDTHVIAYDRTGPISAAYRAWWQFRTLGHKNISVLDGGLKKWIADGFEVTSEEPKVERSNFAVNFDKSLYRSFEQMLENLKTKQEQLVDSRPLDHHSVIKDDNCGVIAGSKHVGFPYLFKEDGTMKSESELRAMFDDADIDLDKPLLVTCLRGLTACSVAGACHILGKENVPVYQGSWQEFSMIGPDEYKRKVDQKS